MAHTLEADGIQLSFGERSILKSIYVKAETGRITGILGRNGYGKSCLLRIIFGELNAQEQSVRIDGIPLFGNRRNPADIRMLPQFNFLPKHLRVSEAFRYFGVDFEQFCRLFTNFAQLGNLKIRALSGGDTRIIESYLILKSNARFVILDEPFSQLSPKNAEIFIELIKQEKADKGIILTDHRYRHITDISDTLYVISNGQSYQISSPDQLIRYGYLRML